MFIRALRLHLVFVIALLLTGIVAVGVAFSSFGAAALIACIPLVPAIALRRDYHAVDVFLCVAICFGLLPAAPLLHAASSALTSVSPVLSPLALATGCALLTVVLRGWVSIRPLTIVIALLSLGLVSTLAVGGGDTVPTFGETVVIPGLIMVILMSLPERSLARARQATRWTLLAAVALGVGFYVANSGAGILSPSFVLTAHYDTDFQTTVGAALYGNPNNASVVYLTAFGWALAERLSGRPPRTASIFVALSALAVWMTGSKGAMLVAVGLVCLLLGRRRSFSHRIVSVAAGISGIAAIIALNLGWLSDGLTFDTVAGRLSARQTGLAVIADHPLFGTGPGTAGYVTHRALGIYFDPSASDYISAHDMFLNWALSLGVISVVVLVGLLVGATLRCRGNGVHAVLPLAAYVLAAESAGIDITTPSNPAWAVLLFILIGLSWRGGAVIQTSAPAERRTEAVGPRVDALLGRRRPVSVVS